MGCNCKNTGTIELPENEKLSLTSIILDYTIRFILYLILLPFIIPITIIVLFYTIVINKGNLNGSGMMKIVGKLLKNAYKEEEEDEFLDEEFNDEDYELDEIIN